MVRTIVLLFYRDVGWNLIWSGDVPESDSFVNLHKENPKVYPHLVQLAQKTNVRLVLANCQKTQKIHFFTSLKGSNKGRKKFFSKKC